MSLEPEQIQENWEKMRDLLKKTGDRSDAALHMVDELGERLALCPASSRLTFHNAFPGGLVDHSLRVLGNAVRLKSAFSWTAKKESLIISCLFHDLGKVGDEVDDYYVKQKDQYKIDRFGDIFMCNDKMRFMTVPDRSVYLCQHFGLKLTHEEFLAIKLNDGQYAPENAAYALKEPMLADIVHIADVVATKQEKGLLEE